jgi:YVTN family beta-propeller protein
VPRAASTSSVARSPYPRGVLAAAACVTGVAGCGGAAAPDPADPGRVGASIAVLASGDVAVVDTDAGSISLLDPTTLEVRATVDVGGVGAEPRALVEVTPGVLLVSLRGTGEVVQVDAGAHTVTRRARVCAGPWGLALTPDLGAALVGCEWDGSVVRLDVATLSTTVVATGLSRPRAVASLGDAVWVADFTGGSLHRIDAGGPAGTTAISLVPAAAPYRPALTAMTANLAAALVPAFGRLHVAHELVNNTGDTATEKVAEDYGSVVDGNPKINPAVSAIDPASGHGVTAADPPVLYAQYDGGARAFNAPVALAAFGDRYLLVANQSSGDVAVVDSTAASVDARVVGSFAVGSGPSGVAVDAAGSFAYVDNAFDASVSRLDLGVMLDPSAPRYAAVLTTVRALPPTYSFAALAGRRLFHDATNPHVTPSGVVACSTCHPGGGDDGLVWFVHTADIPLKRRRTPHLANAHTGTAPFHWNGQFATIPDLVDSTVVDLMAGDGLLVDGSTVAAYIDEIVTPPLPPALDPAAVARGQALFDAPPAACGTCHGGADHTDDGFHVVLDPMSLHDDDTFPTANTPALHGLFGRAPYFHDGRATDLNDLLTRPDAAPHGGASALSPGQRDDLIAYLWSL